jgi:hypothetical protein
MPARHWGRALGGQRRRGGGAASDYRSLQHQVRELQRLLGKKTLENEILREALDVAQPKNAVAFALIRTP